MQSDPQRGPSAGALGQSADPELLHQIYEARFDGMAAYRNQVWRVLIHELFERWIPTDAAVLDVGCGHGEFINNVPSDRRSAIDLNPGTRLLVDGAVSFFEQDCTHEWPVPDGSQDVVFSSNFIEHLPSKDHVLEMFRQAHRSLADGGRLILLGPNLKFVGGRYWDFFDHHVALTDQSVVEALETCGFVINECLPRVLPYTMSTGRRYPLWLLRAYLRTPRLWRFVGEQFVVVATRPSPLTPLAPESQRKTRPRLRSGGARPGG